MDTTEIIAQIDSEIARLKEAKSILSGTTATTNTERETRTQTKKRTNTDHDEEAHPLARGAGKDRCRPKSSLGEG